MRKYFDSCPKLLSLKDTASKLKLSEFTLRHYCRQRKISHYRIFGRIKFSLNQIEEFMAQNEATVPRISTEDMQILNLAKQTKFYKSLAKDIISAHKCLNKR